MLRIVAAIAIALLLSASAGAQVVPVPAATESAAKASAGQLRLFLDCNTSGCDFDYLRTQMTWIDYVRDRTAADVHVIVTSLSAGGGGSEVTMQFIGRSRMAGVDDELRYQTPQGATQDERRVDLTKFLKLGLTRYVARLPEARNLNVNYAAPRVPPASAAAADPWKLWVFSLGMDGYLSGESRSKNVYMGGSLSARRTTKDWKFSAGFSGNRSSSEFTFGDGTKFTSNSHSYYGNGLIVRSLTDHLSAGATFSGSSSTEQNIDLSARVAPTLEYDIFPYAEYSKRRLIIQYSVGLNRNEYTETTIFDRDQETRVNQALSANYATQTTWGSASVGISRSNYLSDFSKNRLSISAFANVRLVKGLSLNYGGSYARVRDQITLPRAGATDEEVLLRLKRLQTNYQYFGQFGLSYTFGSVFNSVVNSRMGGGGGGVEFFF